ncbi:MAG TPA: Uma2 family endonuclease [Dehalococcoidia bacterium]|nr:Uma2 family endonuclease [Dehalococcoidia bacterium]
MTTEKTLVTIKDVEANPPPGRWELLDGEVVPMPPAGGEHNWVMNRFDVRLTTYVEANDLGVVLPGDTGIILGRRPDRIRAPDLCFFAKGRLPGDRPPSGYLEIIPDFVVEIVSPGDRAGEIQQKTDEWLNAGVRLVWVAYPESRTVVVSSGSDTQRIYRVGDALTGDPVLPGFSTPVAALFA